jgi:3-phosphoshikimate 1-carboxyvinyltransferase
VSALILASTKGRGKAKILVDGDLVSKPYVDATLSILSRFGGQATNYNYESFDVEGEQDIRPLDFAVPADMSSCALLISSCLLSENKGKADGDGKLRITGIDRTLPQGDFAFLDIVKEMTGDVKVGEDYIDVRPCEELLGGEFNLHDTPDLLPPLAILGLKVRSPLKIVGVEHARYKETNRVAIIANELSKVGLSVQELRDGLVINSHKKYGKVAEGVKLDAHNDHRLFMAFCALGLGCNTEDGVQVEGLESLDVSYPEFLHDLTRVGASIKIGDDPGRME